MPNIGKKTGGPSKGAGKKKKETAKQSPVQVSFGSKKAQSRSRKNRPMDDDAPLTPDVEYEEQSVEQSNAPTVSRAEPFSDGLVSVRLKGLTIIPRIGGEEVNVLHDFLELFARTEPFIGSISSKTSFMKKTGGRLL